MGKWVHVTIKLHFNKIKCNIQCAAIKIQYADCCQIWKQIQVLETGQEMGGTILAHPNYQIKNSMDTFWFAFSVNLLISFYSLLFQPSFFNGKDCFKINKIKLIFRKQWLMLWKGGATVIPMEELLYFNWVKNKLAKVRC